MVGICILIFAFLVVLCGTHNKSAEALYYEQDFEALYDTGEEAPTSPPIGEETDTDLTGGAGDSDVEVDAASLASDIYNSTEM